MEIKINPINSNRKLMLLIFILLALALLIFVNLTAFYKNVDSDPTSTTAPPNDIINPLSCGFPIESATALMADDSNHQWTAQVISGSPWLSIIGQTTFTGNGYVNYSVTPNYSNNSRFGLILMNGYSFVIEQKGLNVGNICSASVSPNKIFSVKNGGVFRLYVNSATDGNNWNVQIFESDSAWISATKSTNYVDIKIEPNEKTQRISYFMVADRRIPVIQEGNIP